MIPLHINNKEAAQKMIRTILANPTAMDEMMESMMLEMAKKWQLTDMLPQPFQDKLNPPKKIDANVGNTKVWLDRFLTEDNKMLLLKAAVNILADNSKPVLIIGESGTGKELLAHALHGIRDPDKFIDINCAGLPEYLIESELFGHARGAFTGADKDKRGLMEEANDGTLFLDEIGDLPLPLQSKFLRAIQDKRIRPVGSNSYRKINCRIVSATHQDLSILVTKQQFRLDLYERISTFELFTSPLRERPSDIELLLKQIDPERKFPVDSLYDNPPVYEAYKSLKLPGNYRTLIKYVERFKTLGQLPPTT